MATTSELYGTYVALTVTNLQSLANDASDPFACWQSARISNLSDLANDREFIVDLSTAATAPANDSAAYVYVVPWMSTDGGTTWIPGGNFGTTTAAAGTEGTASISDPNSMAGPLVMPYKITSQRLQLAFSVLSVLGWMPDGVSLVIRNCTGAAFGTGCVVGHNPLKKTIA